MAVVQSLVRAPSNEVYQGMHSSATGRRKVAQIVTDGRRGGRGSWYERVVVRATWWTTGWTDGVGVITISSDMLILSSGCKTWCAITQAGAKT